MSDLSPTFTTLRLRRSAWTAPALLADSALVVIGLVLATAIRQALDLVLHPAVPFATYYLVTVLLGCIWSMRAGITSLFLGLMTGSYFFVDPAGSVIPRNAGG